MSVPRHVPSGLTLVELMLALAISSIATLGAVSLYTHSASVFRAAQSEQYLEETAQLAITALRRDIELAGFIPFTTYGDLIDDEALQVNVTSVRNDCGNNWAIRIAEPVGGSNGYRLACGAWQSAASGADTLIIRYVDPSPATVLEPGHIYLQMNGGEAERIFVAPNGPLLSADPLFAIHALHARAYYVSTTSVDSTDDARVPSLRVKQLTGRSARPVVVDEEVQPGIEDMQLEFQIGTNQFVTGSALAPDDFVQGVRVWVLVRSAFRENNASSDIPGYAERGRHTYDDGYRRKLVTTTIAISNDRPL